MTTHQFRPALARVAAGRVDLWNHCCDWRLLHDPPRLNKVQASEAAHSAGGGVVSKGGGGGGGGGGCLEGVAIEEKEGWCIGARTTPTCSFLFFPKRHSSQSNPIENAWTSTLCFACFGHIPEPSVDGSVPAVGKWSLN